MPTKIDNNHAEQEKATYFTKTPIVDRGVQAIAEISIARAEPAEFIYISTRRPLLTANFRVLLCPRPGTKIPNHTYAGRPTKIAYS